MRTVERAYELARAGTLPGVEALIAQLKREGHEAVEAHLAGHTQLRKEIVALCRASWIEAGNMPVPSGRKS